MPYEEIIAAGEALSGPYEVSAAHGEVLIAVENTFNLGQRDETRIGMAVEFHAAGAEELAEALQRAAQVAREQEARRQAEDAAKESSCPA